MTTPLDLQTYPNISVKTWSPKTGAQVKLKIENQDASVTHEVDLNTSVANAWEDLLYDFSGAPAADYVRIVIFFDFEVNGDDSVYYFDEIELVNTSGGVPPFTFQDFEGAAPAFTVFGNIAATEVIANPDASGMNTTANVAQLTKTAGSEVWAGTFFELSSALDGSRTWRIKAEAPGHFGLGPVGGINGPEWYSAGINEKVDRGIYDDSYIFAEDGTFTHITDNTNDDPDVNTEGTVFGRINLIDELAGPGGTQEGDADIINYPYSDYTAQWSLSAPGGVETLSLTGTAFMGYYVGGDHKYRIISRSADEMVLSTTDGNNEFGWWFTLIAE